MIKQQVGLTKTFDNSNQRISVLIRAADLLWPYEQKKARAVFTEAFELATEKEKENEANAPTSFFLRVRTYDERYVVITAIAKRDRAWARDLTAELVHEQTKGRDTLANRDLVAHRVVAMRLLNGANEMMATDLNAALDFAKASFNFPATVSLTHFLYRLAAVDQQRADQLYLQALTVYGDKPFKEFLYLQAYPFAWRETLNTPVVPNYAVPANFVMNPSLQRRFLKLLLRRAQQAIESPSDPQDTYRSATVMMLPGTAYLLQGLITLEPQVRLYLPDLLPSLIDAREKVFVSLSVETQKLFQQPGQEVSTTPVHTFDEQIESALKEPDTDERDQLIVTAVFGSENEALANVVQAVDKITDSDLRGNAFEWLYFHRAVAAIKNKQFDDAEKLIAKVEGHEQRAFLLSEIAGALLTTRDTQTRAQQLLEDAITEAKKTDVNVYSARALLTASALYAKIDLSRAIAVLADAINCLNRIDNPDFRSDPALEKSPERKGREGEYQGEYEFRFYLPGLDPESTFREMAKFNFDTALSQTTAITHKFQRAMSTLALAETCLTQAPRQPPRRRTQPRAQTAP
ncbi:MAG TPA: hypothetical protein VFR51_14555 [Pyrinomonadaceae bacterium]|nr:hypothetical protein [Pyrinomonadaceae bacterium]